MVGRVLAGIVLILMMGLAVAQEPSAPEPWPISKLDFGRPVEVAKFTVEYACAVYPISLEFAGDQVHLVYMIGRGQGVQPAKLLYRRSLDRGRNWNEPVLLAEAPMAHACRDGDVLWVIAVCGNTEGFHRYGTSVKLIKLDLKTGLVASTRTLLEDTQPPEPDHSYGMASITAQGERLLVTVIENVNRVPDPQQPAALFQARLLVSTDTGATWKVHPFDDVVLTSNPSIAPWPMLRPDGFAAVLGGQALTLAEVGPQGLARFRPFPVPGGNQNSVEPLRMTGDGKAFFLALAQPEEVNRRLVLTKSPDGVHWSAPIPLTGPMPYELVTPFTSLSATGSSVIFGYTATHGNWRLGDTSAYFLISRDAARSFERVDLGGRFRHGSLLPVTALDPDGKRIGCAVVALVPRADEPAALDGFVVRDNFVGDAYLLFASSPPITPVPAQTDVALVQRIEELVRQLGSPEYEQRERASADLHELGGKAVPFLEKAIQDNDLEIATRARMLLRDAYPPWLKPAAGKPDAP